VGVVADDLNVPRQIGEQGVDLGEHGVGHKGGFLLNDHGPSSIRGERAHVTGKAGPKARRSVDKGEIMGQYSPHVNRAQTRGHMIINGKKMFFQGVCKEGEPPFSTNNMMFPKKFCLNISKPSPNGTILAISSYSFRILFVGCVFAIGMLISLETTGFSILFLFMAAISAIPLVTFFVNLSTICRIKVDNYVVTVTQWQLFFYKIEFSEDLRAYEYIDSFSKTYREVGARSHYTRELHFIALIHLQTELSIPLWFSESPPNSQLVANYARALGMPIIERNQDAPVTLLNAEDWASPLKVKAEKGIISQPKQTDWTPPSELSASQFPGELVVNVARRPLASRVGPLIAAGIIVVPLVILGWLLSPLVLLIGLGGLGLAGGIVYYNEMNRRLIVTRTHVRLENLSFGTWRAKWTIPHHEILSLEVIDDKYRVVEPVLSIWTKQRQLHAGQGLSLATLSWLKDYITSAVVTA
jgi:hypothetical protein